MNKYTNTILSYKNEISAKYLADIRRKLLNEREFSIISNNCWAGWVYRRYGLEYQTPTVGLYMFAEDYILFCKSIDHYLGKRLKFIQARQSKYYDVLQDRKQDNVPIGILDDNVEIVFLHYMNENEAYEKWNRRLERVKKDKLIFKFSEMDLCSYKHIYEFDKLPYKKKVCFTAEHYESLKSCVPVSKVIRDGRVANDTLFYADYINLTSFINDGLIKPRKAAER